MTLGVVEVTRFLDAGKLETDLQKVARVRKLGECKRYTYVYQQQDGSMDASSRRPLASVVGLQGNVSLKTIVEGVKAFDDDLEAERRGAPRQGPLRPPALYRELHPDRGGRSGHFLAAAQDTG